MERKWLCFADTLPNPWRKTSDRLSYFSLPPFSPPAPLPFFLFNFVPSLFQIFSRAPHFPLIYFPFSCAHLIFPHMLPLFPSHMPSSRTSSHLHSSFSLFLYAPHFPSSLTPYFPSLSLPFYLSINPVCAPHFPSSLSLLLYAPHFPTSLTPLFPPSFPF